MPDGEPWGLKPYFHLQNCLRIRSDKCTKLLLQASPVIAWALAWSSWPRGGQVCLASLPCSPGCSFWDVPRGWHTLCETRQGPSSPSAGWAALCSSFWVLLAVGFDSPGISKNENRFLTGVGLDGLMDYLLLCISHFDDPVSNKPSSLLKHSRVV